MQIPYDELLEKYNNLIIEKRQWLEEKEKFSNQIQNMQQQLQILQRYVFGSKREKTPEPVNDKQCSLFENTTTQETQMTDEEATEVLENLDDIIVHKKKNSKKVKAGIKKNKIWDVLINKTEYILNDNIHCPCCNGNLKVIGKKILRNEIRFFPAHFDIEQHIEYVYKCENCCNDKNEKHSNKIFEPNVPKALLPHSFASPSLATEVMYNKFYMGVPFYRQEKMWDDKGLVLPRNMMSNWCIKLNEYYLEPLWKLMLKRLKQNSELLHCDESTIQCNKEPGRSPSSKSYMWVLRSGDLEKQKGVVFKYSPSRSAKIAQDFLEGYKGILVTDRIFII